MTDMRAGLRVPSCAALSAWLGEQVGGLRAALRAAQPGAAEGDQAPVDPEVPVHLYAAALEVDFHTAANICAHLPSAPIREAVLRDVIDRIEEAWQSDRLSVLQASDAFWTLKRALAFPNTGPNTGPGPAPNTGPSTDLKTGLHHPGAVIYVPADEEHSFGAQLLGDQLRARGHSVTLALQGRKAELYEMLEAAPVDILAISLGYDHSLLGMPELIEEARIVSSNPKMLVALGGQAVSAPVRRYDFLRADLVARPEGDPVGQLLSALEGRLARRGMRV